MSVDGSASRFPRREEYNGTNVRCCHPQRSTVGCAGSVWGIQMAGGAAVTAASAWFGLQQAVSSMGQKVGFLHVVSVLGVRRSVS